jgi:hypothetical protein
MWRAVSRSRSPARGARSMRRLRTCKRPLSSTSRMSPRRRSSQSRSWPRFRSRSRRESATVPGRVRGAGGSRAGEGRLANADANNGPGSPWTDLDDLAVRLAGQRTSLDDHGHSRSSYGSDCDTPRMAVTLQFARITAAHAGGPSPTLPHLSRRLRVVDDHGCEPKCEGAGEGPAAEMIDSAMRRWAQRLSSPTAVATWQCGHAFLLVDVCAGIIPRGGRLVYDLGWTLGTAPGRPRRDPGPLGVHVRTGQPSSAPAARERRWRTTARFRTDGHRLGR